MNQWFKCGKDIVWTSVTNLQWSSMAYVSDGDCEWNEKTGMSSSVWTLKRFQSNNSIFRAIQFDYRELLLLLPIDCTTLQASIHYDCELRNCFQSHSWFPTRKYYNIHWKWIWGPFQPSLPSCCSHCHHHKSPLSAAAQFIYFISFVVWCSLLNVVNETDDWLYVWLWNRIHDVNAYTMGERMPYFQSFAAHCAVVCSHSSIHLSTPCTFIHAFVRSFVYSFFGWASALHMFARL